MLLPDWMQTFIPSFGDGMAGNCNLILGCIYNDAVSKVGSLVRKMALKTQSMQSIAIGGYSQGGPVAVDASLYE